MHATPKQVIVASIAISLAAWAVNAWPQQSIANPLIRPTMLQGSATGTTQDTAGGAARIAEPAAGAADPTELRRQAERRITQEDLNLRQQALNSPVLPVPLINLFANVQVTAYFQGAIVMRKVDNDFTTVQITQPAPAQSSNGRGDSSAQQVVAVPRPVSRSSSVLRLRVGKTENVSGYPLRAMVNGQDITVDWLSDNGVWVNVFFGALESSAGGLPQVPSESQLLKVETDQFDHLVPSLRTQTFSTSGTLGGQQGGNFGSGFGGNGNQGSNQPGFGTGFPN